MSAGSHRRTWAVRLLVLLAGAGAVWLVLVGVLMLLEGSMLYFPARFPVGEWDTAGLGRRLGCRFEDLSFTTEDGRRLHGWWVHPPAGPEPVAEDGPVLLYFHGNAGNLTHRAGTVATMARLGLQVLIFDYRGYGRSEGRPSEHGLYQDARAAWRVLTVERGISPGRIVLYGKSLGGGVAVQLATEVRPAGLVLQSTFSSVPDLAAFHYPFVPRALVRTRMESARKLPGVRCPVLIVHSRDDEIVPFAHAERLLAAAPEPRQLLAIEGAGHNDTFAAGGERLLAALSRFAREPTAAEAPPSS
ncbi:MAG: alpha/beta hydrolase [Thermoanaerobaculaceae bacterium]|nr:alpha/beta hydrolase [Thermoanaerobaculaceae bacterium]